MRSECVGRFNAHALDPFVIARRQAGVFISPLASSKKAGPGSFFDLDAAATKDLAER